MYGTKDIAVSQIKKLITIFCEIAGELSIQAGTKPNVFFLTRTYIILITIYFHTKRFKHEILIRKVAFKEIRK